MQVFHICLLYRRQKVFRTPCHFALSDLSNTDIYCSFSFSSLKLNPLNDQKTSHNLADNIAETCWEILISQMNTGGAFGLAVAFLGDKDLSQTCSFWHPSYAEVFKVDIRFGRGCYNTHLKCLYNYHSI